MNWRPKWSTVAIALAVIAAVAIASPAFGISNSIKKAIRKEVSKQIAKATGPVGTSGVNGTNGTNGTNGANGTPATRLFAAVEADCTSVSRSSGGVTVTVGTGGAASLCTVSFPQAVAQCVPAVTIRQQGFAGELSAGGNQDGATATDAQIVVAYHDSAGALKTTGRPPFFIAVFC